MNLLAFMKSTRSIAVVVFTIGIHIAIFLKVIPADVYTQIALIVFTAYFARDTRVVSNEN